MKRNEFYNKTQLKELGWTNSLIKKFITIEATLFPGLYTKQPSMCFPIEYIEKLEKTNEFIEAKEKSEQKSILHSIIAENKKEENIKELNKHLSSIKIKIISDKQLINDTLIAKNDWYNCVDNIDIDVWSAPNNVKERWIVNYIRHNLTEYDDYINKINGNIGKSELYYILHSYILEKIGELYPKYKAECKRQINYKYSIKDF